MLSCEVICPAPPFTQRQRQRQCSLLQCGYGSNLWGRVRRRSEWHPSDHRSCPGVQTVYHLCRLQEAPFHVVRVACEQNTGTTYTSILFSQRPVPCDCDSAITL